MRVRIRALYVWAVIIYIGIWAMFAIVTITLDDISDEVIKVIVASLTIKVIAIFPIGFYSLFRHKNYKSEK